MAETRSGPGLAPLDNHLVFGYPVHICDHVPDNKYLCCYCNNILKAAQQTLCGHRYCSACLTWILRSRKSPICPKCAEDPSSLTEDSYLNEDKAFSDSAINKEISELSVHCATAGCRWSGVLREYEGHQVGCGAEVRGRDLADHLDHECPNNRAPPPRCSQRISREQSLKHSCESAISKEPRSREPHLPAKGKDPQKSSQHCHFTSVGCTYRGSRDEIKKHEKSAAVLHMSLVLPILQQMQSSRPAALVTENRFCDYNGDARKLPVSIHHGEYQEVATDCGNMAVSDLISRISALESRIQVGENIIMVMNREIDSYNAKLTAALEEMEEKQRKVRSCQAKISDLCCTIAKKDMEVNELQVHLATLEQTSYDGIFLWKISDFTRKCQDAGVGRSISLYSPAFYTAKYGYKVCLRVYLNGDGAGKGTHISLFFAIMRGEYDVLLSWPFRHKVTFMLLDQSNREHVIDAFRPDHTSISFHRPVSDMNIASGCPLFCPLSKLQAARNNYLRDDTMFIRCIIDTGA